jgi:2-polyprenyl-6-hydroxyphenyl methylase/3-demethylubiquinone-9 3-methyltransferase
VLLADVLEHIPDHHQALAEAARIVRASGWVYVNTINRTLRAHLLAVLLAEGVGLIPRGTHDPKLFLRPEELRRSAERLGLRLEQVCGEAPVLWQTLRTWTLRLRPSNSLALGYSALLRKASRRAR